jgi:hypothetical protein
VPENLIGMGEQEPNQYAVTAIRTVEKKNWIGVLRHRLRGSRDAATQSTP